MANVLINKAFSLTWPASMQIYWNERSVYIRKEFNSLRICSVHQHGRRFIVLEHQYGRRDVMWKRSIGSTIIHVQSYFLFFFLAEVDHFAPDAHATVGY